MLAQVVFVFLNSHQMKFICFSALKFASEAFAWKLLPEGVVNKLRSLMFSS